MFWCGISKYSRAEQANIPTEQVIILGLGLDGLIAVLISEQNLSIDFVPLVLSSLRLAWRLFCIHGTSH